MDTNYEKTRFNFDEGCIHIHEETQCLPRPGIHMKARRRGAEAVGDMCVGNMCVYH